MLKMDRPSRLGRASLETLAIIAYRQPLTKSEIEEIRGVDVSANIKTLMDMQLIRLVGKSELPGHPFLYGTTPVFLEHFGLASLQQLNELDPTLQRSNPKKKAELYRKPKTDELAAAAAAGEADESVATDETVEAKETVEADETEEIVEPDVAPEPDEPRQGADDDDVFIDDTPDEFDDDDDDDDEDEDGEEDEDEEGDGADGADDPDRV